MLLVINQTTNTIESVTTARTENNRPLADNKKQFTMVEKLKPPLRAFHVTDDAMIAKICAVMENPCIIKEANPVFDKAGNLIDISVTYFDFGEDR
ncbi:MAG TPA: hypothetical protein VHY08_15805 [Bacillota bacterium]|nr:hypothetical protein [Bacillota bacterium]